MPSRFVSVSVPQLAWYGDSPLKLKFPASWQVATCPMQGYHDRPLRLAEMKEALAHPIGSPPLREVARGKKDVAILFDDMTRPTQLSRLVPLVLRELQAAGVPEGGIRFIAALGAHGARTRLDFAKKLGEEVVARFPVYNHNPYENCTYVGKTSRGTPVSINSDVMACDFKIGLGLIVPHPLTGYGGGGKIVLPGVSALKTIIANHRLLQHAEGAALDSSHGLGKYETNPLFLDIEEATRMVGLDMKIDVLVNYRRETVALFAGEPRAAHRAGIEVAKSHYATAKPAPADIVVSNAYGKGNEAMLAIPVGAELLKESGGDLVLLANTPEGQVVHYLLRTFGKQVVGQLYREHAVPPRVKRLIVWCPYPDLVGQDWMAPPQTIHWARTWDEVLALLREGYPGPVTVAVIPDGTIQYFPA